MGIKEVVKEPVNREPKTGIVLEADLEKRAVGPVCTTCPCLSECQNLGGDIASKRETICVHAKPGVTEHLCKRERSTGIQFDNQLLKILEDNDVDPRVSEEVGTFDKESQPSNIAEGVAESKLFDAKDALLGRLSESENIHVKQDKIPPASTQASYFEDADFKALNNKSYSWREEKLPNNGRNMTPDCTQENHHSGVNSSQSSEFRGTKHINFSDAQTKDGSKNLKEHEESESYPCDKISDRGSISSLRREQKQKYCKAREADEKSSTSPILSADNSPKTLVRKIPWPETSKVRKFYEQHSEPIKGVYWASKLLTMENTDGLTLNGDEQGDVVSTQPIRQPPRPLLRRKSLNPRVMAPPGLEVLDSKEQVIIRQQMDIDLQGAIGSPNTYRIWDISDEQLFFVAESSSCMCRWLCGPNRRLVLDFFTPLGDPILTIKRLGCRCDFCCILDCCLCLQKIYIQDGLGRCLGAVKQRCSIFRAKFDIVDHDNNVLFKIFGPMCALRCCTDLSLGIYDKDGERQIGRIQKKWGGARNDDINVDHEYFDITFPKRLEPVDKACIIG
ncbi:hypothetical protein CHS0354_022603, partial [Potamilus streckersoni]